MDYIVGAFAVILFSLVVWALVVRAKELHKAEKKMRWMHPPDNDDGISRLEDDPDGQYQR